MTRRSTAPEFIEALARGLDVIRAFRSGDRDLTLAELAGRVDLARPTVRRILLTLEELGYVRSGTRGYSLTARVLDLGLAYVQSVGLWDVVAPHLERLSRQTGESCSIAELDGSDVVYVARVAVPKVVGLAVRIGTRFPAHATSLGKVMLAALGPKELDRVLRIPSRSEVRPLWQPTRAELAADLAMVRAQGWALTDEQLAKGIRSVGVPIRRPDGTVVAAMNVNTHVLETPVEHLVGHHLPRLLQARDAIEADLARLEALPLRQRVQGSSARTLAAAGGLDGLAHPSRRR
jgi:IclR family pca regulon transcriptional regulator